ncbi:MAG: metal-dependent hydrolase [Candidatus Thermoplasmatota archaeon]|nr:metal-dependent hydrolase [Candidatus Thermoplasmatota archaeon]
MFPFGHLGLTLALVVWPRKRHFPIRVDYRVLLAGALVPDLIDKPLSLILGVGGRAVAHTLLFALALSLSFLLLRSQAVSPRRQIFWTTIPLALAIGTWTHLILDRMWMQPEILFWPFLGFAFPLDIFDPFNFLEGYRDPYVLIGDILGALALGYLGWRHRIYRVANFFRLLRKGRLGTGEASSIP